MKETYVRQQDWWDCLVAAQVAGAPPAEAESGVRWVEEAELAAAAEQKGHESRELRPAGPQPWEALAGQGTGWIMTRALRQLGLRSALLAQVDAPGHDPAVAAQLLVSLAGERPTLLQPLPAASGPPRWPAERFRPVLLQSRWIHSDGSPWSLPLLREASVRGLPTSLAVRITAGTSALGTPHWQPELPDALAEHVRYAGTLFALVQGPPPERPAAQALLERLAEEGPGEVVLCLGRPGCYLREEQGEQTYHAWRETLPEAAPGSAGGELEAGAFVATYLAARRTGARARRAVVWGLLGASHATGRGAELLDRATLDRYLQKTAWDALSLRKEPGGRP